MSKQIYEEVDAQFARVCSEATLQSDQKGFFRTFSAGVCEVAERDNWLQEVLMKKNTDAERIQTVLGHADLSAAINETLGYTQPVYRGKDAALSRDRRNAAEEASRAGDSVKALALCSQAVIRAPPAGENELIDGGISLALALWTRSEILMSQQKFEFALQDLKLALKERLPAKQRSDYYWRLGKCYQALGEVSKAKVSYDLAARLVGKDPAKRAEIEADIESLSQDVVLPKSQKKIESKDILLAQGLKQSMPSLSRLVKIVEDRDRGRYAVAGDDIKTGDILLIDEPYASCLLPQYFGSHCCNCFIRLIAPVWCPTCSAVAFCSPECQMEAVSSYHKYECNFLDLFIGSGMSILTHIALRMVTQLGLETALAIHAKHFSSDSRPVDGSSVNDIEGSVKTSKLKTRKEKMHKTKKRLNNSMEKSEDEAVVSAGVKDWEYMSGQIYALCTHFELRKDYDYMQRLLMAMFLQACLRKSSFFDRCSDKRNEAELAILEMLLRNLQLLQFNAHEIYLTVRSEEHKFSGAKSMYVAVGIYPTGALFNHECYPAVTRYFDGKRIILRAIRPLKANETISENYGPQFLVKTKVERQRSLTCRYWFRCECVACLEDWPTLKQMVKDEKPKMRCLNPKCNAGIRVETKHAEPTFPSRCYKCNTNLDVFQMESRWSEVMKCISDYQRAASLMEEQHGEDAAEVLRDAIDTFHHCCLPPHKETHIAQEALRNCYADTGNVHIVES